MKRFALLVLAKPKNENRQNHGVVGAEQSFERDQQSDGEKVGRLDHEALRISRFADSNVDTIRIKFYT
jgi:hypothetical protein